MKYAIWIAAVVLYAGLLPAMAQRGSAGGFAGSGLGALPTGGLGTTPAFASRGTHVPGFGGGGNIHLKRFPHRRFGRNNIIVFGYGYPGFYGYDEEYPQVIYENPPRVNSLPQPEKPVYEAHVPQAPLIIEKVGDTWVRRQVVEAGVESQSEPQFREEVEQTRPQPDSACKSRRNKDCKK
ncbi:MAG: hypothetical protein ACE14M_01045 [Terriglobales bacterium]